MKLGKNAVLCMLFLGLLGCVDESPDVNYDYYETEREADFARPLGQRGAMWDDSDDEYNVLPGRSVKPTPAPAPTLAATEVSKNEESGVGKPEIGRPPRNVVLNRERSAPGRKPRNVRGNAAPNPKLLYAAPKDVKQSLPVKARVAANKKTVSNLCDANEKLIKMSDGKMACCPDKGDVCYSLLGKSAPKCEKGETLTTMKSGEVACCPAKGDVCYPAN